MRYLLTITLCLLLYAASIGPVWGAWQRGWLSGTAWNRMAGSVYWPLMLASTDYRMADRSGAIWIDGPLADYLEWWD